MQKFTLMKSIKDYLRIARRICNAALGKDVFCRKQTICNTKRHGSEYGGWMVDQDSINKDSIVYSFGLGEDISFDLSLIKKYGLKVHGFDPTPRSIQWIKSQEPPSEFILHEFGLADYDGIAKFKPPENPLHISHRIITDTQETSDMVTINVKRINTILNELRHSKIDILKMDIEGAEFSVLEDILKNKIEIKQILVEFHHKFKHLNIASTKKAIRLLNEHNFLIFHISPSGGEYSFIRI